MLLTQNPEVTIVEVKRLSPARSLSLPLGLVPTPTPIKLSPLNDVADEAEDRVPHGRNFPWPDHPRSSTLNLLGSIAPSGLHPAPPG